MATSKIPCPRCGVLMRVEFSRLEEGTGREVIVHVHLNEFDVRHHIPCFTGPNGDGGEPIPVDQVRAA